MYHVYYKDEVFIFFLLLCYSIFIYQHAFQITIDNITIILNDNKYLINDGCVYLYLFSDDQTQIQYVAK